ncbi:MAG: hypothetical protein V8T36_08560 [Ruthenibacterium lactatiformans]
MILSHNLTAKSAPPFFTTIFIINGYFCKYVFDKSFDLIFGTKSCLFLSIVFSLFKSSFLRIQKHPIKIYKSSKKKHQKVMARFEKVSKSMKKHEPSNRQKEKGKVFYNLAPYLTNITHAFRLPFQNFPGVSFYLYRVNCFNFALGDFRANDRKRLAGFFIVVLFSLAETSSKATAFFPFTSDTQHKTTF